MPLKKPEVYLEPKERAARIVQLLEREHPDAKIALNYANPLELLVATMLSAQTTDERVNQVTTTLFRKYRKPEDYAQADLAELEQDIRSTGFYHNKAKNLKKTSQMFVEKFQSQVPKTMEELIELPGVARKTANIVLYGAYGSVVGVAVDTHVRRLAQRLGLSESNDPVKIEQDLMRLVPKAQWMRLADLLIFHGRRVCDAKKPNCKRCILNQICPSAFTFDKKVNVL
ncbi:MAG: endonuclease III [Candidatus Bathyarchaeota archaeon]|nr:endonuclease III [Candidatus Bathyarchaeota archaeon]